MPYDPDMQPRLERLMYGWYGTTPIPVLDEWPVEIIERLDTDGDGYITPGGESYHAYKELQEILKHWNPAGANLDYMNQMALVHGILDGVDVRRQEIRIADVTLRISSKEGCLDEKSLFIIKEMFRSFPIKMLKIMEQGRHGEAPLTTFTGELSDYKIFYEGRFGEMETPLAARIAGLEMEYLYGRISNQDIVYSFYDNERNILFLHKPSMEILAKHGAGMEHAVIILHELGHAADDYAVPDGRGRIKKYSDTVKNLKKLCTTSEMPGACAKQALGRNAQSEMFAQGIATYLLMRMLGAQIDNEGQENKITKNGLLSVFGNFLRTYVDDPDAIWSI